jgi:dihydropteroate synthase
MQAAIEAGAYMINDVNALQATGSLQILAASKAKICLMHMQGQPRTMQLNPQYNDVIAEVKQFLHQRVTTCLAAGINADRIYLDVGFGFGKSLEHNFNLIAPFSRI